MRSPNDTENQIVDATVTALVTSLRKQKPADVDANRWDWTILAALMGASSTIIDEAPGLAKPAISRTEGFLNRLRLHAGQVNGHG